MQDKVVEEFLDALGEPAEPAPAHLTRQILQQARPPAATSGGLFGRLLDSLLQGFWRPALAASLPLVLGFVIGAQMPGDDPDVYVATLLYDDATTIAQWEAVDEI